MSTEIMMLTGPYDFYDFDNKWCSSWAAEIAASSWSHVSWSLRSFHNPGGVAME